MIVHDKEPFDAFYSRNHGPFPDVDPASWRLCIDGLVDRELVLSLADLQQRFAPRTEVVTLECAGNRRAELLAVRDIPGQVPWGPATISTAAWTGVSLADVPAEAGPVPAPRTSPSPRRTSRRAWTSPTAAPSRCRRPARARCCWPGG
jgi:sulfite oxidase